jgi:hypothetical protein
MRERERKRKRIRKWIACRNRLDARQRRRRERLRSGGRFQGAHALLQLALAANQLRQGFGQDLQSLVTIFRGRRHCLHYK